MVDTCIGPYKIIREIADDRVGQVFEAADLTSKKHVVIKSLRPDASSRPEIAARLYSRAETLAHLNHPHIARIFGFIRLDDRLYLVMEYVEGQSLQSILTAKGRLEPKIAFAIFHQILAAVKFAHELGVVHGDLKPSNIMVSNFGLIKVLDFAIAPILGDLNLANRQSRSMYWSPEQTRGEPADVRSDTYALGILLYQSIVGKVPFRKDGDGASDSTADFPVPQPSQFVANCPSRLDEFFRRALAASPADRFQSISAMSQAIGVVAEARAASAAPKRGRMPLRLVKRFSSVPAALFARATRIRESITVTFGGAGDIIRQKNESAMRTTRAGMDAISPTTRLKGAAAKLQSCPRRVLSGINTMRGRLDHARVAGFAGADMARQKYTGMGRAVRRGVEASSPATRLKRGTSTFFGWMHRTKRVAKATPVTANPLLRSFGEFLDRFSENGGKRYVVLTLLLASALIEMFIFGGKNTILRPADNIKVTSRSGTVPILSEVPDPPAASTPDDQTVRQPTIVKGTERTPKTFDKTKAGRDDLHYEALNSRRTVTYRSPRTGAENPIHRPGAHELRVTEPPRRNAENSAAKKQLNVIWEN
jgi:hypothetical protein